MKTETHPFDGVGDNSVFQTKLDLREETLKKGSACTPPQTSKIIDANHIK